MIVFQDTKSLSDILSNILCALSICLHGITVC
ncbi:hypothetical protein LINGRAHAP2_LOCUS26400 [Linum grandiflorum]